ncbi:MAG: TIGR03619 family F420-dependent LLM class oxidoreductase [Novosphingobium sp.]|nr:TIGR03619 family F420-dependent LLM class oxidoreductase [Novosphingobium sp.]MCP5402984.1 TIGR03619 family F420-dependent LLM class oxidoreductase [Novosphingobium sp.]
MELAFSMPHLMEVTAITTDWERQVTGAQQVEMAKFAEKLGYAMIAVPEHFVIPRQHLPLSGAFHLAAYPSMAFYAGATETIRVNSCIAIQPVQNPIVTAKTLSTMDWLSSGRVTVTFASGWLKGEFEALGVDYHQRGAMSEEYTQAIIELWTSDNPEFEGKYISFRDVAFEPKCFQKPHLPIWFGGDADPVLRRIARYATGWWPFLTKPEDIPDRLDYIRSQPDYNGRLEEVFFGFSTTRLGEGHVPIDDPKARPGQTKQEIIDRLCWFGEQGVTMSSVPIPEVKRIEEYYDYAQWVAEEIMPAVR